MAPITMRRLTDAPAGSGPTTSSPIPPSSPPSAADATEAATPAPPSPQPASGTYVVRAGDSFWRIAADRLAGATGQQHPDERRIAHYWRALVADNRDRLVRPGDPDLLRPGQVLQLPPADV
jgi:nucleoid-associated protein YgaU